MVRKMLIALAAAAAVIAGSTIDVSARIGGGMGHGGMGRGGFGGMGHAGFARMGGMGHVGIARAGHFGRFAAVHPRVHARPFAFRHNRFAFRHRFFRNRFAVVAAVGLPFAAYSSCYERVWTPWGWRWTFVCDY